jgi:hypothetical protein
MQRLQQEPALFGIARDDQPRDRLERALGLLIGPTRATLRYWCEPNQTTRMAIAALNVTFAWVRKDALDA